jgi:APA family basic amino acid/polyamine antiporter
LLLTSAAAASFILSGTFEQTIALCSVLFLVDFIAAFLAVFVLRRREPNTARPYKAFAHPASTAIVLAGSVVFLVVAAREDPRSGILATVFMAACVPAYAYIRRRRRPDVATVA